MSNLLGDYDSGSESEAEVELHPSLPVAFGKIKSNSSKTQSKVAKIREETSEEDLKVENQMQNFAVLGPKKDPVAVNFASKTENFPKIENSFFSRLPISNMVTIQMHQVHKSVYGLSLDPRGSRMVTGGNDGEVRIWDFNGMNEENPTPFKQFFPVEGHTVVDCQFSKTGSHILVACSDAHARVYDRNGKGGVADPSRPGPFEANRPIAVTAKGDQYVAMAENTRGHTHMLSACAWHSVDPNVFITSSFDCTVRIWNLNGEKVGFDQNLKNLHVLKCTDRRGICGGRGCQDPLYVTSCVYSPTDSKIIVAGCSDGSLQLFYEKHKYVKPDAKAQTAHENSSCVGLKMFRDGRRLLSRGTDGTVKLWDVRLLKNSKPVQIWND
jgi:WD40 repeat protein